MNEETFKVTGELEINLYDESGVLKVQRTVPNLVVTAGKNWIAARMKDSGSPVQMTHMAIGTDSTAAQVGQTALLAQVGRVAVSPAGGTVNNNVVSYSATFPAGTGTGVLREAGIFNNDTTGTMLCRTVFDIITKGAADTLTINWNVTIN